MTPKEKALKLCQQFGCTTLFAQDCNDGVTLPLSVAKLCAKIAVDQMLDNAGFIWGRNNDAGKSARDAYIQYWQQVRREIDSL